MATWAEFCASAPDLAERGRALLGGGHAFIATTARDGSPRLHPLTPLIAGDRLLAFVARHTVKYATLLRDPRYALHAPLGESDEEFVMRGVAEVRDDPKSEALGWEAARRLGMTSENHVVMEFSVDHVHWAVWDGLGTGNISRRARSWP